MSDLGEVPQELVTAGAPAQFSEWTDEQKNQFFEQAETDHPPVGDQDHVEVAEIGGLEEGEGYA
jgi:hypothetical protein